MSATASGSRSRKAAILKAAYGGMRAPVASQISSASAMSDAAAGSSPRQTSAAASWFNSIGRRSNEPIPRATWTGRSNRLLPSSSHKELPAPGCHPAPTQQVSWRDVRVAEGAKYLVKQRGGGGGTVGDQLGQAVEQEVGQAGRPVRRQLQGGLGDLVQIAAAG